MGSWGAACQPRLRHATVHRAEARNPNFHLNISPPVPRPASNSMPALQVIRRFRDVP
jgi:hypothetical protein